MNLKKRMELGVVIISLSVLGGCAGAMQDKFVQLKNPSAKGGMIRHGSGWIDQAIDKANQHCKEYDKSAVIQNTNCSEQTGYGNLVGGGCYTTFRCE